MKGRVAGQAQGAPRQRPGGWSAPWCSGSTGSLAAAVSQSSRKHPDPGVCDGAPAAEDALAVQGQGAGAGGPAHQLPPAALLLHGAPAARRPGLHDPGGRGPLRPRPGRAGSRAPAPAPGPAGRQWLPGRLPAAAQHRVREDAQDGQQHAAQHPLPLRPEARAALRLPQRAQRLRLPGLLQPQPGARLPARRLLQHHLQPHALPLRAGARAAAARRRLHHRAARPGAPLRVLLPLLRARGAAHLEAARRWPRQAGRLPAPARALLRPARLQRALPPQPALLRPGLRQRPGPAQPARAGAHPGGGAPLPPGAAAGVLRRVAGAAQGAAVLAAGGRALLQAQRAPRPARAAPLGRPVPPRHGLEPAGRAPLPPLQRQLLAPRGRLRPPAHGPGGGRPAPRQRAHAAHLHRRRPGGGRGGHPGRGPAALAAAGRQVHPGLQPQEEHRPAPPAALPPHAHARDPVPDGPGRQPLGHQALEAHSGLPAVVTPCWTDERPSSSFFFFILLKPLPPPSTPRSPLGEPAEVKESHVVFFVNRSQC